MQKPSASQNKILIRSRFRLKNRNRWPDNGSWSKVCLGQAHQGIEAELHPDRSEADKDAHIGKIEVGHGLPNLGRNVPTASMIFTSTASPTPTGDSYRAPIGQLDLDRRCRQRHGQKLRLRQFGQSGNRFSLLFDRIRDAVANSFAPNDRMSTGRLLRRCRTRRCLIHSHLDPQDALASTNSHRESDQACQVYPQLDSLETEAECLQTTKAGKYGFGERLPMRWVVE